jgi:hypothetical protein
MSDEEEEMVTIDVPVRIAKIYADLWDGQLGHRTGVAAACREALAARKTKLEKWREEMCLPWRHVGLWGIDVKGGRMEITGCVAHQTHLMAAAPQLLEALILEASAWRRDCTRGIAITKAIRAALPLDVANEVLGKIQWNDD